MKVTQSDSEINEIIDTSSEGQWWNRPESYFKTRYIYKKKSIRASVPLPVAMWNAFFIIRV